VGMFGHVTLLLHWTMAMTDRWELEFHTTLKTLIWILRNLRSMDCDHCGDLLTDVYQCMHKDTVEIRNRSNDGQQG